jgi:hypothetical protein
MSKEGRLSLLEVKWRDQGKEEEKKEEEEEKYIYGSVCVLD